MDNTKIEKWKKVTCDLSDLYEPEILFKKKIKQIEWLEKYGLKIGDIIQQENYSFLEPFIIKWLPKYKCIGAVNANWNAFHFFGDLFIPEKCSVLINCN